MISLLRLRDVHHAKASETSSVFQSHPTTFVLNSAKGLGDIDRGHTCLFMAMIDDLPGVGTAF